MVYQGSEQLENATYLFITFRYSVVNTVNIDCTNPDPKPLLSQIEKVKLVKFIFLFHEHNKAYFTSKFFFVWILHKLIAILYDVMQQLSETYDAHFYWTNSTFTLFIVKKCILLTTNLNTILAILYTRFKVKKK